MQILQETKKISEAFVNARKANQVLSTYPGAFPKELSAAYSIQDQAIALNSDTVAGWKVGRIPAHLVEQFKSNRLAGPIFSKKIIQADANAPTRMPVLAGFAAAEAEMMLRIKEAPHIGADIHSIPDYIDQVRFGIEIASSPFSGINDHGPAVTVSDYGNNFGLLLGPEISNWRDRDLMNAPVELFIDEQIIGTGKLQDMLDGPFGSVLFLHESLATRGLKLNAGDWISTGAITGVHQIGAGQIARATFDGEYSVAAHTYAFEG